LYLAELTNLGAWLSGIWFDLELVGGTFKQVAYALSFVHAVDAGKAVLNGNYEGMFPHIWWVIGYAVVVLILAVLVFSRKMKGECKND
jgi:ABC-2 type transport system permease protein